LTGELRVSREYLTKQKIRNQCFWTKISMFHQNFVCINQNFNFQPKFCFSTNRFPPKISIAAQNFDFGPKFRFTPKILFSTKISIYAQNFVFRLNFWFSTKISGNIWPNKKNEISVFRPKFRFLTLILFLDQISIVNQNLFFDQTFDFKPK